MRAAILLVLSLASPLYSQVKIEPVAVRDHLYMLVGQGGNIGVSVGADGVFMIDDQFAPLTDAILAEIGKLSDQPVRFLVNTHWHGDHTGGNENLGKRGAVIVAHDNVRRRLSTEQFQSFFNRTTPPAPPAALPVITFADQITFHWNDEEIRVFHVQNAHTDGDAIIHFVKADAVHMGDCFFNGAYPFIDVDSGGSIAGIIAAVDRVLAMIGGETRVIPGHGPLAGKDDLVAYRSMLVTVQERVRELMDAGKTREEVVAAKPTADLDAKWGRGFMKPDAFVGLVHAGMAGR